MARTGYLGGSIIRPGGGAFPRVGPVFVANIARPTGLGSHVANIKRQNIVMDAATIIARQHDFVTPHTKVELSAARNQHFGATSGQHAAHAVKRYTFDNRDIVEVYTRPGVDEVGLIGLQTMLGLVTDVDRRANLSIDKRLENNPMRLNQLQHVVGSSVGSMADARELARELELQRRYFENKLLQSMESAFGNDQNYRDMIEQYKATLSASPRFDETPATMVDMIARLVDD
jgi:hypothetical protein